jgi:L-asparaginase/Glu-tRNA(Gln) amidotransferase subunit D
MERPDLQKLFQRCRDRGLPVVICSQCQSGGVDLATYELGRQAQALGALSGGRHTPWAALAKLSLVLGSGGSLEEMKLAFATSWAGEPI